MQKGSSEMGFRELLSGNKYVRSINRLARGHTPVYIEFPVTFKPRWTNSTGNPPLEQLISSHAPTMKANLESLRSIKPVVEALNAKKYPALSAINWENHFIPALDAFTLMWAGLSAKRIYMEVGSGNSTLYVKAALLHEGRDTRIVSIDPQPRADVDKVCDEVFRQNVEDIDLAVFDRLEAGDVLFIDNSHRSFMNSDVTVCMLDIIPRLKPGVLIGVHDIFLPFDYFQTWNERGYNEQYLLACYLLANPGYFDIQFCNYWISVNRLHHEPLADIWAVLGDKIRNRPSSAFWGIKR
jgi:hypothetical protein